MNLHSYFEVGGDTTTVLAKRKAPLVDIELEHAAGQVFDTFSGPFLDLPPVRKTILFENRTPGTAVLTIRTSALGHPTHVSAGIPPWEKVSLPADVVGTSVQLSLTRGGAIRLLVLP